jgi:hypothetical protein
MPSAERTRKSPNSLGAGTTAGLFAFFALKTFFFVAAAQHRRPAE